MQLSEHFSLAEMTVTKSGLANIPNQAQIAALEALCENILEKIRGHYRLPVIVTSAFRSKLVNDRAGGAGNSQHLKGEAADIHVLGVHNADLWSYIVNHLPFDQCIAEQLSEVNGKTGWVHVSHSLRHNRKDALSFLGKGKYVAGLHYVS